MNSWWELGEWSGYQGAEVALYRIECPFCEEKGNFELKFHATKKKANDSKLLNFDTLECGNCKGYVQVFWSASSSLGPNRHHNFLVQPYPLRSRSAPEHWPQNVVRFWQQASNNLRREDWDSAAVMTRSALQAALRDYKAEGKNLKEEIDNLAAKGILPGIMKEWASHVRLLGNDSAHPSHDSPPVKSADVQDVFRFLTFLLQYLYDLPKQIKDFRNRQSV